jgi:aminoglycoside phosphotransferase (APT) family kinase protein
MPDRDYPAHWTVNRWLPGKDAAASGVTPTTEMASDLARFLAALQSVDAQDAPPPSADNFFRGGSLTVYDAEVHDCLGALADVIDSEPIVNVWEQAIASRKNRSPVWIHGDIAPSNLLIDDHRRLSAVIDFGQLAAGDPACDLTIAWTFFSGAARRVFREQVGSDAETWVRARGWALWKALLELRAHLRDDNRVSAEAAQVIAAVLSDDR